MLDFANTIRNILLMSNSTSVEDNLPLDGERVLVAAAGFEAGDRIHIGTRSGQDWFSSDGDTDFEVLFWMALPDEPDID
jgi:hypothetical protein